VAEEPSIIPEVRAPKEDAEWTAAQVPQVADEGDSRAEQTGAPDVEPTVVADREAASNSTPPAVNNPPPPEGMPPQLALVRYVPPPDASPLAEASAPSEVPTLEEEVEEIFGHPDRPNSVHDRVNFMAQQDDEGNWVSFRADTGGPEDEGIKKAMRYLEECIKVCEPLLI
jgi:hypothetical protein